MIVMDLEASTQTLRSIGVLLVNTGSPKEPELPAVERYLDEFLSDSHIMPMHPFVWKLLVRSRIIPKRKELVTKRYASIWNYNEKISKQGSPLVLAQDQIARKLEEQLSHDERAANLRIFVRSVINYGEPRIEWIMQEFKNLDLDEIVIFPTFPQHSYSASQSCIDHVYTIAESFGLEKKLSCVEDYHVHPAYISALAYSAFIKGFDESLGDELLLSYHSVPLKHVAQQDNYKEQCEETSKALSLAMCLEEDSVHHAYQSVFGKAEKWLGPLTKDCLLNLGKQGKRRIYLMCPGFAFECLETLIDIPEMAKSCYQEGYRQYLVEVSNKSAASREDLPDAQGASEEESPQDTVPQESNSRASKEEDLPGLCYIPCLGNTQLHVQVLKEVLSDHLSLDLLRTSSSESFCKVYEDFAQNFGSHVPLDKTDTFPAVNVNCD